MTGARTFFAGSLLLLAACGEEAPTVQATQPSSPSPQASAAPGGAVVAPPIEDAATLRDDLLAIAQASVGTDPGPGIVPSFGIYEAWQAAYPDLSFSGYQVPPDAETVPVYSNLVNAKEVEGEDNPYILAFAIQDTAGTCVGGVAVGYPAPDTFMPVDEVAGEERPCHPLAAATVAGYETFG